MKTDVSADGQRSDHLQGSAAWVAHFRENVYREWNIPWMTYTRLSLAARARIASSVAEFQRGESSEAQHYLAKSEAFSRETNAPDFHAASILFVREENGHAALLLRFMRITGIAPRQAVWTDGVFRWLRSLSDLGWSSRVLLIAELIAQEYYPCLHDATPHPILRTICEKVIVDENAHIRFQVERIATVEARCSSVLTRLRDVAQRLLMLGTASIVYVRHRPVLETRFGVGAFVSAVVRRNENAIASIRAWRAERDTRGVSPVRSIRLA